MKVSDFSKLKIAIVSDWLTNYGGAESVIEFFCEIFPEADLLTTIFVSENMKNLGRKQVKTSFLQKFPKRIREKHRVFLSLLPMAIESLDLTGYDLVISSSSFVGKGALTNPDTLHVSYVHTPARFLWGEYREFVDSYPLPRFLKFFLPPILHRIRKWDAASSARPDFIIANSDFIKERIWKFWQRDSVVLFPPVDTQKFTICEQKEDFYLFAGRLVPQKDIVFLVEAFNAMPQEKLRIIGTGPMQKILKKKARSNIEFLGYVSDEVLGDNFQKAKATIFPHVEDAGIVPLESLASGTPVIAYNKGGVKTSLNGQVAVFFDRQDVDSFKDAIQEFSERDFDPVVLRERAEQFSKDNFKRRFLEILRGFYDQR
ncbi:MAG: glycosyltransferase [Candidatus Gracilibacteria bacterium]|jgi:glycosyltransferase involved in cell wall biosynthesis|nr:glycosyltransferase [Candidatus Gracilibacteria bacterium]